MDKQVVSLKVLNVQPKPLVRVLGFSLLLFALNACDFLDKTSSPFIPQDDPGANVNLGTSYPAARPVTFDGDGNIEQESISVALAPSSNSFRMTSAQRQNRSCPDGLSCTSSDLELIEYAYTLGGLLDTASEYRSGPGSELVTFRQYFYNGNRLDRVAVSGSGDFHTLHHYFYDDEDDPSDVWADVEDAQDQNSSNDNDGYNRKTNLTNPKLRREYICDIDTAAPAAVLCDRSNASEVIDYVYYDNGILYRKEFDIDNNNTIDHQKIYYYQGNALERVEVDNFYNGDLDEIYTYTRGGDASGEGLEVAIDNDHISPRTRGPNIFVTYELDANEAVVRECYFEPDYPRTEEGTAIKTCSSASRHNFQWIFTWTAGNCWAGGIDDIDPEARAIDYLCKQP